MGAKVQKIWQRAKESLGNCVSKAYVCHWTEIVGPMYDGCRPPQSMMTRCSI